MTTRSTGAPNDEDEGRINPRACDPTNSLFVNHRAQGQLDKPSPKFRVHPLTGESQVQPVAPRGPVYRIYGCSGVELVRQLACTKRAGLYFNIRRRSSARAAVPIDARQGAEVVGCWGLRGLFEPRDAFIFRLGLVSPRRLQRTPDVNERHALLASAEAVLFLWQDGVGPGLPAWRAIPVSSRCLRMYCTQ